MEEGLASQRFQGAAEARQCSMPPLAGTSAVDAAADSGRTVSPLSGATSVQPGGSLLAEGSVSPSWQPGDAGVAGDAVAAAAAARRHDWSLPRCPSSSSGDKQQGSPTPGAAPRGASAPEQLEADVAAMLSFSLAAMAAGAAAPHIDAAHVRPGDSLPVLRPEARMRELKRDLPLVCHIQGCGADLRFSVDYYQRYRVCKAHLRAPALLVDGIPQRFCQQCGRFQPLHAFDADKRNCRARLRQHNNRRRKAQAAEQEAKRAWLDAADSQVAQASSKPVASAPPGPGAVPLTLGQMMQPAERALATQAEALPPAPAAQPPAPTAQQPAGTDDLASFLPQLEAEVDRLTQQLRQVQSQLALLAPLKAAAQRAAQAQAQVQPSPLPPPPPQISAVEQASQLQQLLSELQQPPPRPHPPQQALPQPPAQLPEMQPQLQPQPQSVSQPAAVGELLHALMQGRQPSGAPTAQVPQGNSSTAALLARFAAAASVHGGSAAR